MVKIYILTTAHTFEKTVHRISTETEMSPKTTRHGGGGGGQVVKMCDYCTLFLTTAHFITAHFSLENCTFLAEYCTVCVQVHAIANPVIQKAVSLIHPRSGLHIGAHGLRTASTQATVTCWSFIDIVFCSSAACPALEAPVDRVYCP
jgi:hypothetical protein